MSRLALCPMTRDEAFAFIEQHHRHHGAPVGHLFAIGCYDLLAHCSTPSGTGIDAFSVVGVVTVGRPVARELQDGWTCEATRCCTVGTRNACSMLYGAAWRAARALGYQRLVTYTLKTEGGTSLRAAGFTVVGRVTARSWSCPSRPRVDTQPLQEKLRWEVRAS